MLLHTCVLQPPPAYVHPSPLIFDMFCSLDSGPVTRLSCQPAHFYQRWNARTAPVFTSHLTHITLLSSHPDCHKTYCNPLKPSTVLKTCDMWSIVLLSFSFMIYKLDHELWINCFFSSIELVFVISMELWKFLIL